ncbi:hypothetical protein MMC10_000125 [Thelotrema lepadinum]|nr:hypothetical protein [Thelotrema lepadinum]
MSGNSDVALFSRRLEQWSDALQELYKSQSLTAQDRRAAAILEMNRRQFDLSLMLAGISFADRPDPMWWDDKLPYFKDIVNHATAAVDHRDEEVLSTPCFSLDYGINVHLYIVAVRCRDPVTRRRAIALIRSANRFEGIWRSDIVAHVSERIVSLEEEGLENVHSCRDVPREARLQDMQICLLPAETKVELNYWVRGKRVREALTWQGNGSIQNESMHLDDQGPTAASSSITSTLPEPPPNPSLDLQKLTLDGVVLYGPRAAVLTV